MDGLSTTQDLDKFLASPVQKQQQKPAIGPPQPPQPKQALPDPNSNVQDLDKFLKTPLQQYDLSPVEKYRKAQAIPETPEMGAARSTKPPAIPWLENVEERVGRIKVAGDLTLGQAYRNFKSPLGRGDEGQEQKIMEFRQKYAGKPLSVTSFMEGAQLGVGQSIFGLMSPENMTLMLGMGALPARSAVKMMVDAGFTYQMATGVVEGVQGAHQAIQQGNAADAVRALTGTAVTAYFLKESGEGLLHETQVRMRAQQMRESAMKRLDQVSTAKFGQPWAKLNRFQQAEITYDLTNSQNAPVSAQTAQRMGVKLPGDERQEFYRRAQTEASDLARGTAAARGAVPPTTLPEPPAPEPMAEPEKGPYQPVTGGIELPDNESMYMTPEERGQRYYTLEEARKRLDEERGLAAQEQETRKAAESELERVARERREQAEGEAAYRETRSGKRLVVQERRGLQFDTALAEANKQEHIRLTDEMNRISEEHMYVDVDDMIRSIETEKGRGRELDDWKKNVLDLESKRRELLRLSDPSVLEPRRTEVFQGAAEDIKLANREADMRDAAAKIETEAKKQTDADEFEKMTAEAEEAKDRAEKIRTERDKKEAERIAATAEREEYPLGTIMDMVKGTGGNIILPDGRKVAFHYAVVPAEQVISSHDPFNNFEPNPNAIQISQGRDYKNNRESQAATIARGKNPEMELLVNTAPTAETGPPIVRSDGQALGGRNRVNIWKLLYKNGFDDLAYGSMTGKARELGVTPEQIANYYTTGRQPMLVRVLDDPYTSAKDLARLGRDLDRNQTMGFSQAEEAVMAGRSLSDKTLEWMSGQLDAMGEDASLRDLMRYRGGEIVERMLENDLISPTQRAEYITPTGEMTEKAKDLFESAVLGKVIDDPELIQTTPKDVLRKLERSVAALARVKSAGGLWDFMPELKSALQLWKRVDSVRDSLNEIGKADDSLVDRYLNPGKYKMGTELMKFGGETVRETPHPTVEALAKLLEKTAKEVKFAVGDYADDSEGKQITMGPAPVPVESFNRHIGNLVKVDVPDEAWGVLKPKTPLEPVAEARPEEKAPEAAPVVEPQPEPTAKPVLPEFQQPVLSAAGLQSFLESRPSIGELAKPMMDAMGVVVKNATGMDMNEFIAKNIKALESEGELGPGALSQGLSDVASWARGLGSRLTVTPFGEQLDIFGGAEPQYMLRNGDDAKTERLVLKSELLKIRDQVPQLKRMVDREGNTVKIAEQGDLFGPPPAIEEEEAGPQGTLFQAMEQVDLPEAAEIKADAERARSELEEIKRELETRNATRYELMRSMFDYEKRHTPTEKAALSDLIDHEWDRVWEASKKITDLERRMKKDTRVGVLRKHPDGKVVVYLSNDAMSALKRAINPWGIFSDLHGLSMGKEDLAAIGKRLDFWASNEPSLVKGMKEILQKAHNQASAGGVTIIGIKGKGIRAAINVAREELLHHWQREIGQGLIDQHLSAEQFKQLHDAMPASIFTYLHKNGYKDEGANYVIEAAAKMMTGKLDELGVTPEEAASFLDEYFRAIKDRWGLEAFDNLTHTMGIAKMMRDHYMELQDEIRNIGTTKRGILQRVKDAITGGKLEPIAAQEFVPGMGEGRERSIADVANPQRDTETLKQVQKEHPEWTLSQQLQEAAKRVKQPNKLLQGKLGAVQFGEDGKAVIHLFENANPSTFLHEFFHVMRRYLKPEDQKVMEDWLKIKDGMWSRDDEEKAARAWEYYHHQRPSQTLPEKVAAIFKKIQTAMRQVYERLKGSPLVKPSKEVSALFDRWYGKEMTAPPSIRGVPMGRVEELAGMLKGKDFVGGAEKNEAIKELGKKIDPDNPPVRVEFEHAIVYGTLTDAKSISKNKTNWGKIVDVNPLKSDDPQHPNRIVYELKETHAGRQKFENRAEIKALMEKDRGLVKLAMKLNKKKFIEELTPQQVDAIRSATGLDPGTFWHSVKTGKKLATAPQGELRMEPPPGPEEQPDLPGAKTEAQRLLKEGVTAYGSGANRAADIRGMVKAGIPIGVDVSRLSENTIKELESLAGKGIPVFVDSGAFGEMRVGSNGLEVGKEITDGEWRKRLDVYHRLADKLGSQLTVVAPDRVGDQTVTLERLKKYAADLQKLKAKGVEIVIPVQFGEMSEGMPDEFYFMANEAAGFDVYRPESRDKTFTEPTDTDSRRGMIPGLPMNKAGIEDSDVTGFIKFVRPHRVHLLGMGAANDRVDALIKAIHLIDPEIQITMDANLLRAHTGEGRRITEAQRGGLSREEAIAKGLDSHKSAGQLPPPPGAGGPPTGAARQEARNGYSLGHPWADPRDYPENPEDISTEGVRPRNLEDAWHENISKFKPKDTAKLQEQLDDARKSFARDASRYAYERQRALKTGPATDLGKMGPGHQGLASSYNALLNGKLRIPVLEKALGDKVKPTDVSDVKPYTRPIPRNSYLANLNDEEVLPEDVRSTPAGEPTVDQLLKPGDMIRSNYSDIPYVIEAIKEQNVLDKFPAHDLVLREYGRKGKTAQAWINELVAEGGRIKTLFKADDSEVFKIDEGEAKKLAEPRKNIGKPIADEEGEELPPPPKKPKEKIPPAAKLESPPLTAEDRKDLTLKAQGGILPLDTTAVRSKVFPDLAQATEWAKGNKDKIKGLQIFQLKDGRAVADFTAKKADVLFQLESGSKDDEARIRFLQGRLSHVMSDAERAMINRQIRDLKAKQAAPPAPGPELAPPPGQVVSLWTPEGEREVKREPEKETRPARTVPNETVELSEPPRPREVSKQPRTSGVPQPKPTTGGGVRTAPAGKTGGTSVGEPRTTLRDVRPLTISAVRARGEAAYSDTDWAGKVDRYRLPENAPAPTRKISDELGRMLMPGQREVVESVVSGLDQYDGYILATTTGTGKTYMGSAILADLFGRKPDAQVLVLTPSQSLVHGRDGWIQVAGNFGVEIEPLPVGGIPDKPGTYIKTWAGGIANRDIESVPWDLVIMDEVQEARKWWSSQRGDMSKTMGENSKKILYTSATPFHTALEIGHMGKLGLWGREGFEQWATVNGLGVYRNKAGELSGGNAPLRLEKLRQQLIERGQMINIDRNMDGYSAHFGVVPMDGKTATGLRNIDQALQLAERYFERSGKKGMIQATKAQRTTLAKRWLEYQRLPQAIDLGRKLEKQGWKVVFFSENKKEFDELFDFLQPADAAMGGKISELMPKFKGTTDVLREAFGEDVAVFAGKHSAAREAEKDAFNDDKKSHLYATYGAGGVGVSLHDKAGDKPRAVIYLGPPWSGISFDQALGRPWRYGTKSNVRAYFLFSDAQAEMDLVTNKVAPRMESLRAMVSGVNFDDPVVKNLRSIPDNQVGALDYDHGNAHEADFNEFTKKRDTSGVTSYADLPIVSAEEAKNKGMRLPGSDGAQDPSVIRLWQDSADDEVLPADFEAPELTLGRAVNIDLGERFIESGAAPGFRAGRSLEPMERRRIADVLMARAESAASGDPASATQQVYTEWENGMKQLDAILSDNGEPPAGITPPPGEAIPNVPGSSGDPPKPEKIGGLKAFDWYALTNGRDVIRGAAKKAGVPEIGEKIARSIAQYHVEAGNIAGPWTTRYWDIVKGMTPDEHRVFALTLANREKRSASIDRQLAELRATAPMTPKIEKAVEQAQALFKEVFSRMQKDNIYLTVWDAVSGKPRQIYYNEFASGKGYWPRKYDYDTDHRVRDPETGVETVFNLRNLTKGDMGDTKREQIIRGMMERYGLNRAEVEDFLQAKKRDVPLVGHIERAREADMPFFRTDPEVVISYLEGAGELLSRKKYFEQDGSRVKGLIAQIPDQKARNITAGIVESLLKRNPMEDESRALLRFAADWSTMKMAFSAIKVLGHPVHGSLLTNLRSFGKALYEGTVDYKEAARRAQIAGSTQEQTKIEMLSEFGINKKGLASTMLRWNGWQGAYKWGRVVADANARVYMTDYAMGKLLKDPKNDVVRRQLKEFMQLDDEKIDAAIARRRFTEEDLAWAGKAFSDKVMFTFDPTELPPWWRARAGAEHPAEDALLTSVRVMTLLKGYQFKTHALLKDALWDEAMKGNFRPLIPFLLLYPTAGFLIHSLSSLATANSKYFKTLMQDKSWTPGRTMWRMVDEVAHQIGDSALTAWLDAAVHGKESVAGTIGNEYFTGAVLSDAERTIALPIEIAHAKSARTKEKAVKRYVEGTVPVARTVFNLLEPPPQASSSEVKVLPHISQ